MGHAEVEVRWSAGAVPPASGGAPWRLSLDVAPVLEPGESGDVVVGDVFVAAANAGLFVHTLEGRRVLFDVAPSEAHRRCKRIPLLRRHGSRRDAGESTKLLYYI